MGKFWTSFKAFVSNPIKFLYDPANTVIEYSVNDMAQNGATREDIIEALGASGYGPDTFQKVYTFTLDKIDYVIKNIWKILLIAIFIMAGWYMIKLFILRKALS